MATAPQVLGAKAMNRAIEAAVPLVLRMRLADWPIADRIAWQRALSQSTRRFGLDIVTPSGRGGEPPSPATTEIRQKAYGTFAAFLARHLGEVGPSVLPHVTPAILDAYVTDQESRGNRPVTIAKRIDNLQAFLRLIAPAQDFAFLRRPGGLPLSRVFSRKPRTVETRDTTEIIDRITALHAAAKAGECRYASGHPALRDAALLAILASRAPRIGEVTVMELGRHLVWRTDRWDMQVEVEDNKNDRYRRMSLPDWVQPILSDYIQIARPAFGGHATPALWMSTRRGPCSLSSLSAIVVRWTTRWFGQGRGPHWLRKCLTTFVANEQPELLPDVAVMIDHGPTVALGHYNLAKSLVAGRRHNARIEHMTAEAEAAGLDYLDRHRPRRRPATWQDRYCQPAVAAPAATPAGTSAETSPPTPGDAS